MINKATKYCIAILCLSIITAGQVFAQNYGFGNEIRIPDAVKQGPIQGDIQSQRIAKGTLIKIRINETPVNSHNSRRGDSFSASIIEDVRGYNGIILPAGSGMRGRVGNILPNGYLSRGAELTLVIDHVVTPAGREIPLVAKISNAGSYIVKDNGTIAAGGGYADAVSKGLDHGIDLASKISSVGIDTGVKFYKNINNSGKQQKPLKKAGVAVLSAMPIIFITPVAVAGGAVVGSADFFGRSVVAVFKKGKVVKVSPGDIYEITLVDNVDIPLN